MKSKAVKQRDIYLADLNPVKGSEQRGTRPVVIISGNAMNDNLGISIVCPLTSKLKNFAGCIVLKKNKTNGLSHDSEILTFQVRTLAHDRLLKHFGKISEEEFHKLVEGLNEILKY